MDTIAKNGIELSERHLTDLKNQYPKPGWQEPFLKNQKGFGTADHSDNEQFEIAARFYVVNKCGFGTW